MELMEAIRATKTMQALMTTDAADGDSVNL